MKKHVALTLLLVTWLGVLNAHVDVPLVDGRRFVLAQGRLHDPLGWLEEHWTSLTRRCSRVERMPTNASEALGALQAIQNFSPPDSHSARLVQLQRSEDWLLAEVEFARLNPAVVLLRAGTPVTVVHGGIWSGSTEPWRSAPRIRTHLAQRAAQAPHDLLACYTPEVALFLPD